MNDYDSLMLSMGRGKGYDHILDGQIEVADTMVTCLTWWQSYGDGIKPTAADILAMAMAVLARGDAIKARREREAEARLAEAMEDAM
jgi:hypothetical protein